MNNRTSGLAAAMMLAALGDLPSLNGNVRPRHGEARQSPEARALRASRRGFNQRGTVSQVADRIARAAAKRERKGARRIAEARV